MLKRERWKDHFNEVWIFYMKRLRVIKSNLNQLSRMLSPDLWNAKNCPYASTYLTRLNDEILTLVLFYSKSLLTSAIFKSYYSLCMLEFFLYDSITSHLDRFKSHLGFNTSFLSILLDQFEYRKFQRSFREKKSFVKLSLFCMNNILCLVKDRSNLLI